MIENMQKVGRDQVKVTAIRPAAKQTIRTIIKLHFIITHLYLLLPIITFVVIIGNNRY